MLQSVSDKENKGKYRLFSVGEKQRERGGVSSGTRVHVAKSETEASIVLITEDFLKADIAELVSYHVGFDGT